MPESYVLRWRRPGRSTVELDAASGLPQTLREAVAYAESLCVSHDTPVCVIEDGSLVCVVNPD